MPQATLTRTKRTALRMRTSAHALLVLCLLMIVSPACSANAHDAQTVVFWTSLNDDINMAAQSQIVAAFAKKNPDLRVKMVGEPSQWSGDATALITAVRGGSPPDVYLVDRFSINQEANIGLLTDLSPFLSRFEPRLSQHYLPFSWQEATNQGHPYGIPLDTDARALYYNKDLLRQAHIDPALFSIAHGPMTIDEAMQVARKMDRLDTKENYTQMGFIPWLNQGMHTTWELNFGAQFFNKRTCRITPTEPAFLQTFQDLARWSRQLDYNRVDSFVATYQPPNAPPSQTPFFTNRLGMLIDGNWAITNIQLYAPTLPYGITYLPVAHKGDKPITWSGGFALVMPKGARNTAGGYRFMRFMAGPEGQRIEAKMTGHLPTWTSLLNESGLLAGDEHLFATMLPGAKSRPPLPVGAQLSDALDAAQQAVLMGSQTPMQALKQVYARVQPQMQQYCPFATHKTPRY